MKIRVKSNRYPMLKNVNGKILSVSIKNAAGAYCVTTEELMREDVLVLTDASPIWWFTLEEVEELGTFEGLAREYSPIITGLLLYAFITFSFLWLFSK
jgi:hypothetical protein